MAKTLRGRNNAWMRTNRVVPAVLVTWVAVGGLSACAGDSGGGGASASSTLSSAEEAPAEPEPSASPSQSPTQEPTGAEQVVGTFDVVTDLAAPWSVVWVGETVLISERDTARILELQDDGTTREVGVIDGVETTKEAGLLGLAVDDRDRLYVYSTGAGENRVQRYALEGEPGSYALGEMTTILAGIPAAATHNGGRMAFGPDGMLYVTTGDAAEEGRSQDLNSLGGKILRMTPDGEVPGDNPFGSLVWTYGHRNVQGLAWTPDGALYASEFGQNTWDELNLIEPGNNYGWPDVEGMGGGEGFTDPLQVWDPDQASPSGMTYLDGELYIANLRGRVLISVPVSDPSTSTEVFRRDFGRLRDVLPSPDGGLWLLTNNTDGRGDPVAGDDRLVRVDLP